MQTITAKIAEFDRAMEDARRELGQPTLADRQAICERLNLKGIHPSNYQFALASLLGKLAGTVVYHDVIPAERIAQLWEETVASLPMHKPVLVNASCLLHY